MGVCVGVGFCVGAGCWAGRVFWVGAGFLLGTGADGLDALVDRDLALSRSANWAADMRVPAKGRGSL